MNLFGLNYLFESANRNATRNGVLYDTLLNNFLTKARRKVITCALVSEPGKDTTAFHRAGIYNISDTVASLNYRLEGKIAFFQLEHEFWNANGYVALSGPTAFIKPDIILSSARNTHFTSVYNDHINFLDTLNTFKHNDANVVAVYDYVDRMYFNWDTVINNYHDTNEIARNDKAKELEKRSDAIFLTHYRRHSSSLKSLRLLHFDSTSSTVKRYTKRMSFFGQNSRKTFIYPLFSGEWYEDPVNYCGKGKSPYDYLGKFFRDTSLSDNNFKFAEDTFLYQFGGMKYDTSYHFISNVELAAFGWFKYSCLKDYTFYNTGLNECPSYPLFFVQEPIKEEKDETVQIEGKEDSELLLFPNPTNGNVSVKGLPPNSIITVYNSAGIKLLSLTENSSETTLLINEFVTGVYLVQISSLNLHETFKVIKQ